MASLAELEKQYGGQRGTSLADLERQHGISARPKANLTPEAIKVANEFLWSQQDIPEVEYDINQSLYEAAGRIDPAMMPTPTATAQPQFATAAPQATPSREPGWMTEIRNALERGGLRMVAAVPGALAFLMQAGQRVPGGWYPKTPEIEAKTTGDIVKLKEIAKTIYSDADREAIRARKGGVAGYIVNTTFETLPMMAMSSVAAIPGGAIGAAGAFSVAAIGEGEAAYQEAIKAMEGRVDLSQSQKEAIAQTERLIVGTINGVIEKMQADEVLTFAKGGKKYVKDMVNAVKQKAWGKVAASGAKIEGIHLIKAVSEGFEEFCQEGVSIGAARLHGDKIEFSDLGRMFKAGVGGLTAGYGLTAGGAMAQTAVEAAGRYDQRRQEAGRTRQIKTAYEQAKARANVEPGRPAERPEIGTGGQGFTPTVQPGVATADEMVEKLAGDSYKLKDLEAAVERAAVDKETKTKLDALFTEKTAQAKPEETDEAKGKTEAKSEAPVEDRTPVDVGKKKAEGQPEAAEPSAIDRQFGALPGMGEEVKATAISEILRVLHESYTEISDEAFAVDPRTVNDDALQYWMANRDKVDDLIRREQEATRAEDEFEAEALFQERMDILRKLNRLIHQPKQAAGTIGPQTAPAKPGAAPAKPTESPMDKARRDLERKGASRVGGRDFKILQRDDGSYYYEYTEGGVRMTQGPAGANTWTREDAIDKAMQEIDYLSKDIIITEPRTGRTEQISAEKPEAPGPAAYGKALDDLAKQETDEVLGYRGDVRRYVTGQQNDIPRAPLNMPEDQKREIIRQEQEKADEAGKLTRTLFGRMPTAKKGKTPAIDKGKPLAPETPSEEPATPGVTDVQKVDDILLSDVLAKRIEERPVSADEFFSIANDVYGGTRAQGKYGPSDAYDALELAVNKVLAKQESADPTVDLETAKKNVHEIEALLDRLPTQTNRSGEKDVFQQFSTPPHYAYGIAWAAGIGKGDVVLEPSAGAGGIAVFAKKAGATVHVNEISERRAALLKELGFDKVTTEDAEQIHNILKDRPSVVLMNPPFSHAGHRMGAKKIQGTDLKHIDAALKLMQDGGRLVAIMGRPLHEDKGESATFQRWMDATKSRYNVRANVYVGRGVYKKYGTSFPTRVLVIDKTGPTTGTVVGGTVDTVADLLYTLNEVRNDREPIQSVAAQPGGERRPPETEPEARPESPVRAPTDGMGPERPGTGRPDQQGTERPARTGEGDVRVGPEAGNEPSGPGTAEPGRRPGVTGSESERESPAKPERVPTGIEDGITVTSQRQERQKQEKLSEAVFEPYRPAKFHIAGARKHPTALVESAPMAAVDPPDVTYELSLPKSVIEKGQLSDIQLENVAYAGMAFEGKVRLQDGTEVRRGYLIGDGTGVGKGREISGIILDQMGKGRKKAIWISKNDKLYDDAKRDWSALGQDPDKLFNLGNIKAGTKVTVNDGIMYLTYGKLRSASKKTGQRSVDQIIEWVGTDFDGVLVFDEAHHMGNAIAVRGQRGTRKPSETALIGAELRKKLPNARVVYVSATAATEVINLAYTDRLGLWGPGTPFPTVESFVNEIGRSGINAMEQVARDMKAMGLFSSRSLSYNDGTEEGTVRFGSIEHKLAPEQQMVYDKVAEAWQIVLRNLHQAMHITGQGQSGQARGQALSQFWGANQRFFNQIITAMKVPSVVKAIEKDLAEGRSAVIQLTSTYEAAQERALASRDKDSDLEDFDLTPVEILMQYVENGFPTQQFEEYEDENGNIRSRPVVDSKGNPVHSAEALEMKAQLLDELGSIRNIVPESPLDSVINYFGSDVVAEATGRTRRVILKKGKRVVERRGRHANQAETNAFMNGKKRVMIFSEAGGTGASYHADMDAKNQQRRAHYVLQPGWRADVCLQGMGRTHRSNQKYAPWYWMTTTNLQGEKRFTSTISRRLNQLGALQFGERKAGSAGLFSAADNLESEQATDALHTFFADLVQGRLHEISLTEFERQTGLSLTTPQGALRSDLPDIRQFLNRLLNLKIDFQNQVFDAFQTIHREKVDQAEAEGRLDVGVQNYPADEVREEERQTVYIHPTGGATDYIKVTSKYRVEPVTWDDLQRSWKPEFYVHSSHDKTYGVKQASSRRDARTGNAIPRYRLIDQTGSHFIDQNKIDGPLHYPKAYGENPPWKEITRTEAKEAWDKAVEALPEFKEKEEHFISGLMLPIWNRLRGDVKLYRVLTTDGNVFIGRKIPDNEVQTTLSSLGVERGRPKLSTQGAIRGLLENQHRLELANGWKLKYSRVGGEARIELTGPGYEHRTELLEHGVFAERIGYTTRWFLPTGDQGKAVYERLTQQYPVVNVEYFSGSDPTIDVPSAQGGFVGGRPSRTAAYTQLSAIVNEDMTTGSEVADDFLRRNRGYTINREAPGALRNLASRTAGFVREFHFLPHLPKTAAFAEVREAFRHSMEIAKHAYTDAAEAMKWALQPIKGTKTEVAKRYDALVMKLQADSLAEDIEKGVALPPDMTVAAVEAMKAKADRLYAKYPSVRQAYDRLREKTTEVTDLLVDMGWLQKAQAKEFYFPHKVIKYLRQNQGFLGITRKPAMPRKGYLKQRKGGHDYAIDLDYMVDHWAQVRRDVAMTKFLERTLKKEQEDHFKTEYPDWKQGDPIPAGFKEVTVLPGRFYYKAHGVSEDLAMALVNQDLAMIEAILDEKQQKGMDAVRTALAVGRKRSFIVREQVADQVYDMPTAPISEGMAYNAIKAFNTFVKRQILFNPLYAVPFHVTNFIGDAHKVLVAAPGALKGKGMVGYWTAILDAHNGRKPKLFDEAQEFGVIGSGWIGVDVKSLQALLPEIEKAEISGASAVAIGTAKRLFNLLKTAGESREDWLRYATFAYLCELQDAGKDITRFATKDTKVVRGLKGHEQAAKIARDILGDYSAIGKSGRILADLAMPFYRWMHLNLPWWPRLIKEYGRRGDVGRAAGALMAALAPYIAAMLWNYSDDDRRKFEEKLPPWKRWTFHVVGVHGKKLYYIPLPLDDLVQFFGLDNSLADFTAYQKGIIDLRTLAARIALNSATEPGMGVVNAVGGLPGVIRDAFGIKTFPELADYRIKEWDRRAMNVAKDIFGAPAQLVEAVRREDSVKTHDLMWRSVLPVCPWTPTSDPMDALASRTYREDQQAAPMNPERWRAHKGKQIEVDRLKAQVAGESPEDLRRWHLQDRARRAKERIERRRELLEHGEKTK